MGKRAGARYKLRTRQLQVASTSYKLIVDSSLVETTIMTLKHTCTLHGSLNFAARACVGARRKCRMPPPDCLRGVALGAHIRKEHAYHVIQALGSTSRACVPDLGMWLARAANQLCGVNVGARGDTQSYNHLRGLWGAHHMRV